MELAFLVAPAPPPDAIPRHALAVSEACRMTGSTRSSRTGWRAARRAECGPAASECRVQHTGISFFRALVPFAPPSMAARAPSHVRPNEPRARSSGGETPRAEHPPPRQDAMLGEGRRPASTSTVDMIRLQIALGELIEVQLEKPLGILVEEREGGLWVKDLASGGNADNSGKVSIGDRLAAVSSVFGNDIWSAEDLTRVATAIRQRVGPVTLILEKSSPVNIPQSLHDLVPRVRALASSASLTVEAAEAMIREPADFELSSDSGTRLLAVLVEESLRSSIPEACRILDKLGPELLEHSEDPTAALVQMYCSEKQITKSMYLIKKLENAGRKLGTKVYEIVMSTARHLGDWNMVLGVFERMIGNGVQPDVRCYTHAIKAHSRLGQLSDALALFKTMLSDDILPDVVVFNALLSACSRANDDDEMTAILKAINDQGLHPNPVTFNILINHYARTGQLQRAFATLSDMCSAGHEPNEKTFTPLLQMCVQREQLARARLLLQDAKQAGRRLDDVVYAVLIRAYGRRMQLNQATRLWQEMCDLGISPSVTAYNAIISACVQKGNLSLAEGYLNSMRTAGVHPSVVTYTTLIDGFGKARRLRDALSLYSEMRKDDVKPNAVTYASLLSACLQASDLERFQRVFQSMKDARIQADVVIFTLLVKRQALARQLEKAFAVVREMSERGILPTTATYNELIGGCVHCGDAVRALRAFRAMILAGLPADRGTYQALFRGYPSHASRQRRRTPQALSRWSLARGMEGGIHLRASELLATLDAIARDGTIPPQLCYDLANAADKFDRAELADAVRSWAKRLDRQTNPGFDSEASEPFNTQAFPRPSFSTPN